MTRWLAWTVFGALLALHVGFRPRAGAEGPALYLGWLPEEMAWRLLWIFLAWLFVLFFTAKVWREDEDGGEA